MKLALFRNPNSEKPYVGDDLTAKWNTDLIRISEWVEVTFPELTAESRQEQLLRVEAAREETRKQYEAALARINTQAEVLGA